MPEITPSIVRAMRPDLSPASVKTRTSEWRNGRRMPADTRLALVMAAEIAEITGEEVESVILRCKGRAAVFTNRP